MAAFDCNHIVRIGHSTARWRRFDTLRRRGAGRRLEGDLHSRHGPGCRKVREEFPELLPLPVRVQNLQDAGMKCNW